jgi:hypothetical protein
MSSTTIIKQDNSHVPYAPLDKKICGRCEHRAGAVTTCDGCDQAFCTKHFVEHRQELSQRLQRLDDEQERLRHEMFDDDRMKDRLLDEIDVWQREAIRRIQIKADQARQDLTERLEQSKSDARVSMEEMHVEVMKCRQCDDFTERDLKRWNEQLEEIRRQVQASSMLISTWTKTTSDNDDPMVTSKRTVMDPSRRMEKEMSSNEKRTRTTKDVVSKERFDEIDGKAMLSEEGVVVTGGLASILSQAIVYGRHRYATGKHSIRFRVEKIGGGRLFFGIVREVESVSRSTSEKQASSSSLYGWWDLNEMVMNGRTQTTKYRSLMTSGDEVLMMIDCDQKQIQLEHQRTKRLATLKVDVCRCPLPWKLVVRLQSAGDSIRIL